MALMYMWKKPCAHMHNVRYHDKEQGKARLDSMLWEQGRQLAQPTKKISPTIANFIDDLMLCFKV